MSKADLLPCPFCVDGGNPKSRHIASKTGAYPNGYYWAGCEINLSAAAPTSGCGVGHSKITEREAIATWNRRAEPGEYQRGYQAGIRDSCIAGDPALAARAGLDI
jgi:hypothetical protein